MSPLSQKSKILVGVIVLVVVIGGVMLLTKEKAGPFSGTMFELFDRGGNWKCSWIQDVSDLKAQGNIFISGKKFKSETVSSTGSVTLAAEALSDGEFFYAWTSLAPIGIRTNLKDLKNQADNNTPQTTEFGKEYTFDCQPWDVDEAAFTIPTDIAFAPVPQGTQE